MGTSRLGLSAIVFPFPITKKYLCRFVERSLIVPYYIAIRGRCRQFIGRYDAVKGANTVHRLVARTDSPEGTVAE